MRFPLIFNLVLFALLLGAHHLPTARSDEFDLDEFEQKYSVDVLVPRSEISVPISGGKITAAAANSYGDSYLNMVIQEFWIYPPAFIKASKLKKIVVCSKLAFNGQLRAAIPDFANDTLYLDCHRGYSAGNYQRTVIHHEFFHIVDYQDDGIVYDDAHWRTLNAKDFKYGKGGVAVQADSTQSHFRDPTNGFLTNYSMAGVEEDKAELFAHLIVSPAVVLKAAKSDAVVDQKLATLKALMKSFCPEMNEPFWKRTASHRLP